MPSCHSLLQPLVGLARHESRASSATLDGNETSHETCQHHARHTDTGPNKRRATNISFMQHWHELREVGNEKKGQRRGRPAAAGVACCARLRKKRCHRSDEKRRRRLAAGCGGGAGAVTCVRVCARPRCVLYCVEWARRWRR